MRVNVLRGPAFGGKSQWLQENAQGDLVLDTTQLWVAVLGLERDAEGKYRQRLHDEDALRLAQYLKFTALRWAAREGVSTWFTLADSSPDPVERVRELVAAQGGAFGRVVTLDPGVDVVVQRASFSIPDNLEPVDVPDATRAVDEECMEAISKWHGHSAAQGAAVRLKMSRQLRRKGR